MPLNQADLDSSAYYLLGGDLDPRLTPNGLDAPRGALYALGGKNPTTLRKESNIGGNPNNWADVGSVVKLNDMTSEAAMMAARIENGPSREEFNRAVLSLSQLIEQALPKKDLLPVLQALDQRVSKSDFLTLSQDYQKRVIEQTSTKELLKIIDIASNKIAKLSAAILALAAKLDAEDVTNLDQDYEASARNDLSGV